MGLAAADGALPSPATHATRERDKQDGSERASAEGCCSMTPEASKSQSQLYAHQYNTVVVSSMACSGNVADALTDAEAVAVTCTALLEMLECSKHDRRCEAHHRHNQCAPSTLTRGGGPVGLGCFAAALCPAASSAASRAESAVGSRGDTVRGGGVPVRRAPPWLPGCAACCWSAADAGLVRAMCAPVGGLPAPLRLAAPAPRVHCEHLCAVEHATP